jgi:hypothetical protein
MSKKHVNGGTATVAEPEAIGGREARVRDILAKHDQRTAVLPGLIAAATAKADQLVASWAAAAQPIPAEGRAVLNRHATERDSLRIELEAAARVRLALLAAVADARQADSAASAAADEKARLEREAETALAEMHECLERFAVVSDRKRAVLAQARMLAQQHDLGATRRCVLLPPKGFISSDAGMELRDALHPFRGGIAEASESSPTL